MNAEGKKIEIKDLPIMPQVATKVLQLQEDNLQISFKDLEKVILLDPALTSKILKVANSALYARQREIKNLQQAITLLGFKMVKSLVLLVCASNIYKNTKRKINVNFATKESLSSELKMWQHLIITAFVARHLASHMRMEQNKEDIFIAGLLHDIGRIALYINNPTEYEDFLQLVSKESNPDILSIEEQIFGFNHSEAGAYIFQKWNFPEEFIHSVAQHHSLYVDSPHDKMIKVISLANVYARIINEEPCSEADMELLDNHIKALNIAEPLNDYILNDFITEIEKDELYTMSNNLI